MESSAERLSCSGVAAAVWLESGRGESSIGGGSGNRLRIMEEICSSSKCNPPRGVSLWIHAEPDFGSPAIARLPKSKPDFGSRGFQTMSILEGYPRREFARLISSSLQGPFAQPPNPFADIAEPVRRSVKGIGETFHVQKVGRDLQVGSLFREDRFAEVRRFCRRPIGVRRGRRYEPDAAVGQADVDAGGDEALRLLRVDVVHRRCPLRLQHAPAPPRAGPEPRRRHRTAAVDEPVPRMVHGHVQRTRRLVVDPLGIVRVLARNQRRAETGRDGPRVDAVAPQRCARVDRPIRDRVLLAEQEGVRQPVPHLVERSGDITEHLPVGGVAAHPPGGVGRVGPVRVGRGGQLERAVGGVASIERSTFNGAIATRRRRVRTGCSARGAGAGGRRSTRRPCSSRRTGRSRTSAA